MTTAAGRPSLPCRPVPTVRRSSLDRTVTRYLGLPEVDDVLLDVSGTGNARLLVCWTSGRTTPLVITEDT